MNGTRGWSFMNPVVSVGVCSLAVCWSDKLCPRNLSTATHGMHSCPGDVIALGLLSQ